MAAYKAYDYPWFSLYDERLPTLEPTGRFDRVRSVTQLDRRIGISDSIDPEKPPVCTEHASTPASMVLRPCGHTACTACFGQIIVEGESRCVSCRAVVERFIGFKKPVARVRSGGGSEGTWWEAEAAITGIAAGERSGNVVTLRLKEDTISPLRGAGRPHGTGGSA
jgi:hypothetical protein